MGIDRRDERRRRAAPALRLALCALLLLPAARAARAAGADLRFGVLSYPGRFGSEDQNLLGVLPVQFVLTGAGSRFTITVPYVSLRHTGNVILTADGPVILGAGGPGRPTFQTSGAGDEQKGLGDIVLTEEHLLMRAGKGKRPQIALVLDFKIPTADKTKGLGTGRRDWSAGLSYAQPLGKVVQILGDYSYRFMGDPEGLDLRDRPRLGAGLAFVINRYTLRTLVESMRPAIGDVPVFDAAGAPIGIETVRDRRVARADLTVRSLLGGSTRIGLTKGLNGDSGDLGLVLIFSTGNQ